MKKVPKKNKNTKQKTNTSYYLIISIVLISIIVLILIFTSINKQDPQNNIPTNKTPSAEKEVPGEIITLENEFKESFKIASKNFSNMRNTSITLKQINLIKIDSDLKGDLSFNCDNKIYYWEEVLFLRLFVNLLNLQYPNYFNDYSNSEINVNGCIDEKGWIIKGNDFRKINN